jgi:sulfur carrier protein
MTGKVTITLNGTIQTFAAENISDLLKIILPSQQQVAVEQNAVIIPRSLHSSTALCDGDQVEIIGFIGGG